MDTFWGHSNTFWTAMQALTNGVYTILVIGTLWFIYLQVRMATKTFQLDALKHLQDMIDGSREDRVFLFTHCPLALSYSQRQFPKQPPRRRSIGIFTAALAPIARFTKAQQENLHALDQPTRESARRIISRFNDMGQLVEDGFIKKEVLLGKYHVLIIQCCHMLEAIRREEERRRGGNYGQRLLRMRKWATNYNDAWSKHRNRVIEITAGADGAQRRAIYRSPKPSFSRHVIWLLRRVLAWY